MFILRASEFEVDANELDACDGDRCEWTDGRLEVLDCIELAVLGESNRRESTAGDKSSKKP